MSEPQSSAPEPGQTRQDIEHLALIANQRRARAIRLGALIAVVVLFIVFVLSNSQPTTVDYVFFSAQPRLIWVMFGCAVIGGVVGYVLGKPGRSLMLHRKPKADDKQRS